MCTGENVACFITPLVIGIIIDVLRRSWKNSNRIKLWILELMLIGGAVVLAVEHAWHGEIAPYPPFLTAMQNPEDIPIMLHEMSTVGGSMTLTVAILWLGILYISRRAEIRVTTAKRITATLKTR